MKYRTPRHDLRFLSIIFLTVSVLLMSSCMNHVSYAPDDGTSKASQETTDIIPETTEPPEKTTAVIPETTKASEKETDIIPETTEPTRADIEPTDPPKNPSVVWVVPDSMEGLPEEKRTVLLRYLGDLVNTEDPSGLDYLSEEVKDNWDYLPYGGLTYSVRIVWDEEDEFLITSYRNSGKAVADGLRYNLIVFRKEDGQWIVAQDIYSDLWMMVDVEKDTRQTISIVFQKARETYPITDEEVEKAREAVLDYVTNPPSGWTADQKASYKEAQEVVYVPDWSDENLPLVLSYDYDYRNPALLFIHYNHYGFGSTSILYASLEDGKWVVQYLSNQYIPELPEKNPSGSH